MAPSDTKKPAAKKTATGGKKASAYQNYMKVQLAKLKETEPDTPHKDKFKKVAKQWADAPENPKNKKD